MTSGMRRCISSEVSCSTTPLMLEWLPPLLCPLGAAEAYLRGDMLLFAVYSIVDGITAIIASVRAARRIASLVSSDGTP